MQSKFILAAVALFSFSPGLALAGTFDQVVTATNHPEIEIEQVINVSDLITGKAYYWAGDGKVVEANQETSTTGAKPVLKANSTSKLKAKVVLCRTHSKLEGFNDEDWLSKNLEAITLFYDKDRQFGDGNEAEVEDLNPDSLGQYHKRGCGVKFCWGTTGSGYSEYCISRPPAYKPVGYENQEFFGSKPGIYLMSQNSSLIAQRLEKGKPLYLAIKADSYGPEASGGRWKVTLGIKATAV